MLKDKMIFKGRKRSLNITCVCRFLNLCRRPTRGALTCSICDWKGHVRFAFLASWQKEQMCFLLGGVGTDKNNVLGAIGVTLHYKIKTLSHNVPSYQKKLVHFTQQNITRTEYFYLFCESDVHVLARSL